MTSISYLSRAPEVSISFIRSTSAIHHPSFPFVLLFSPFFPRVALSFDWLVSFEGGVKEEVGKFDRANDGPTKASSLVKSRHQSTLNFVSNDDGMSSRMK